MSMWEIAEGIEIYNIAKKLLPEKRMGHSSFSGILCIYERKAAKFSSASVIHLRLFFLFSDFSGRLTTSA